MEDNFGVRVFVGVVAVSVIGLALAYIFTSASRPSLGAWNGFTGASSGIEQAPREAVTVTEAGPVAPIRASAPSDETSEDVYLTYRDTEEEESGGDAASDPGGDGSAGDPGGSDTPVPGSDGDIDRPDAPPHGTDEPGPGDPPGDDDDEPTVAGSWVFGRVTSASSGRSVQGIAVYIPKTGVLAVTGTQGSYVLPDLQPGTSVKVRVATADTPWRVLGSQTAHVGVPHEGGARADFALTMRPTVTSASSGRGHGRGHSRR